MSADPTAPADASTGPESTAAPAPAPALLPPAPLAPTIHEARIVAGGSGVVEYGVQITEATAVARRAAGLDIVVRGDDAAVNRRLARKIEGQVGTPSPPQPPHASAGSQALPHFHQQSRNPGGHGFYETDKRKARSKR